MIFVLSTIKLAKKNKYMIGRHNDTSEPLYNRYQSALIDPVVYHSIESEYVAYIENKIKRQLDEYRIIDNEGNKSEWVILELSTIISKIHTIITDHHLKLLYLAELSNKKNLTKTELMYICAKISKYTLTKPDTYSGSDDSDSDDSDSDDSINFDGINTIQHNIKKKIVVDILNRFLGCNKKEYTLPDILDLINITMTTTQYNKTMADIAENSLYFANEPQNRYLFFNHAPTEKKPSSYSKNKSYYFDTIQALLDLFGMKLSREKRVRKNKKSSYIYSLCIDPQIREMADVKYHYL